MAVASADVREALDGVVEDGSFLFAWKNGILYVSQPIDRVTGENGSAFCIKAGDDEWNVPRSPSCIHAFGSDHPLTDDELDGFLEDHGFVPATIPDPPQFPSLDYIHVDAIRAASENGGVGQHGERAIEMFKAFEALRRLEA